MEVNVRKLALQVAGTVALFVLALFLPAGTIGWPAAWIFLALFLGFSVALSLWLLRFNPGLLAERMTGIGKPDQKTWDKVLMSITAVAIVAWLVLMGLDAVRFRWSHVPVWVQGLGTLLLVCAFYLFYVTFRENSFLSPAVRIQTERAHTVVSTGPYRYVRHPLYAAFALFVSSTALLLGSWYGLAGALLLIAIVARRAVLEERTLCDELQGYSNYMAGVRYRILPHVW